MLTREAEDSKYFQDLMWYEMEEKKVSRNKKEFTAHMTKVSKLII